MVFQNHPYCGLEDGLVDGNMIYIDPILQSPSPNHYDNRWATPTQLKENSTTAPFFPDLCRQVPDHTTTRPALGISPVPPPSQTRLASPVSSIELSSSGSAHSPDADTESYHDNIPRTPPDTAVLSPFQPSLSQEPFAHALQFSGMGSGYVNPFDVNPSQPPEYCESDNGIIDFGFTHQNYNFDMNGSCDMEPAQSTGVPGFTTRRASPDQMRPMVKRSVDASSQYPPPPKDEDMGSDDDAPGKRQNDDDADGDYWPNKRQRTAARTPQRGMKTATATTLSASSRRTRNRANNIPPARSFTTTSSSNTDSKTSFTCPTCKQRNFPSQADLDAHIKKQHLRSFNCVFDFAGCDSTFGSKNEWKRHVSTQHLLLHYWVCTEGACANAHTTSPSPSSPATPTANPNGAIFNRKDLFTQHLKRMHAPKAVKDHLPSSKHRTTTTTAKPTPNPTTTNALTQWEARLKHLQENAIRPRCALPALMRCPVPSCLAEPFRGQDAWNQRMEHVAKHMERAAQGKEPRVVFGGDGDATLVRWAARADVAIIVPRGGAAVGGDGDGDGDGDGGPRGWGLKSPLRRGPGGNVVVVAPVRGGGVVGEEIVVAAEGEDEEDAEGEED
jgi:hypothetical protein